MTRFAWGERLQRKEKLPAIRSPAIPRRAHYVLPPDLRKPALCFSAAKDERRR